MIGKYNILFIVQRKDPPLLESNYTANIVSHYMSFIISHYIYMTHHISSYYESTSQ